MRKSDPSNSRIRGSDCAICCALLASSGVIGSSGGGVALGLGGACAYTAAAKNATRHKTYFRMISLLGRISDSNYTPVCQPISRLTFTAFTQDAYCGRSYLQRRALLFSVCR